MTQISLPSVIHSPMPRTPIDPSRLQSSIKVGSPSPRLTSPTSNLHVPTPRVASPAESSTTTSSFTPAVIGPSSPVGDREIYYHGDVARSPTLSTYSLPRSEVVSPFGRDELSSPSQRSISSPFTDVSFNPRVGFNRSPSPVFLSPSQSTLHIGPESDTATWSPSLRTAMFSPSMSSFDGHFEIDSSFDGSDDGSDSSWSNVGNRTHPS